MSLLFPDRCYFCGEILSDSKISICDKCIKELPVIKGETCKKCGREKGGCYCESDKFYFTRNVSLMRYEGPAINIIKRMKFNQYPQLTVYMGDEISKLVKNKYETVDFDFITYVPMHPYYEFRRKFNQARLLAERVGRYLDLEVKSTLSKSFSLKTQKHLGRTERFKMARGKYHANDSFKGKTILLIDDVMTVGATLNECARVLIKAGAKQVYTATFAITCKK